MSASPRPNESPARRQRAPTTPADADRAGPPRARHPIGRLPLLLASGLLLIVALFDLLQDSPIGSNWHVAPSVGALIWGGVFLLTTIRTLGTPYSFGVAYVVMLALFHLGITVPQALGIFDARDLLTGSLDPWLARATWYTVLALGSFGLGYAAALRVERRQATPEAARAALGMIYRYGLGLLIAAAIFLVLAIHSFGNLLEYSRADLFNTSADTRGFGAFMMTFPAALLVLTIGARTPTQRLFAYGLALLGFAAILLSGYRSSALYPLLLGAVLWVKTGRRIPIGVAAAAVALVVLSIPVIGLLRANGPYRDLSYQKVEAAAAASDWRSGILEMGQTAGVLGHTLRLVPASDPYRFGASYLHAVLDALPNVGVDQDQSARAVGGLAEGAEDFVAGLSPSNWLTYRLSPQKFYSGQGLGFSAIAEAYLNFGTAGVVLMMALFGIALARLDGLDLLARPVALLLVAATMFHFVRTVRNEFSNFAKPFVFMLVIFLIWRAALFLLGRLARRRVVRA